MSGFSRCARVLSVLSGAMTGLFMWGPGMTMPPATSVSPPSVCIAQASVYQAIAKLQVFTVGFLFSSFCLSGVVAVDLDAIGDAGIAGMHVRHRRFLRGCMVLAILLSAVSAALGLRTYGYVLEAKVSVLSCLPAAERSAFYAVYSLTSVICAYVFGRFLWVVTRYD